VITGYSGTFGKRASGQLERFNNQTAQWRGKGAITVSCAVVGAPAALLGQTLW
jgi:hypothetical protein